MKEGQGFHMEQQPQRLFLFIGITRLLGQVLASGKAGGAGREGSRGDAVSEAQALLQLPGCNSTPSQATLAPCPHMLRDTI